MTTTSSFVLTDQIRQGAQPVTGSATDYDALIDRIGEARFVLIGEASHEMPARSGCYGEPTIRHWKE